MRRRERRARLSESAREASKRRRLEWWVSDDPCASAAVKCLKNQRQEVGTPRGSNSETKRHEAGSWQGAGSWALRDGDVDKVKARP